jgi:predicted class III extradiol MEMO1 family dioxygenase/AMMECR1 domain-containing protein
MLIECLHRLALEYFPTAKKNKYIKSILIPHAHPKYSGLAAVVPFLEIDPNNYSKVICLCTSHRGLTNIKVGNNSPDELNTINNEHSYEYTKMIIDYFFKDVNVIVEYYLIRDSTTFNWPDTSNSLIVGNSDLWHYGPRFNNQHLSNSLKSQYDKIKREENLIANFLNNNKDGILLSINKSNPCGREVIYLLLKYNKRLNLKGNVYMYYDSTNNIIDNQNLLDLLKIDYKGSQSFVSYVSIAFTTNKIQTYIPKQFERLLLLAGIKSIIEYNVNNINLPYNIIPKWCKINQSTNGVFVGVKNRTGKTRASIGYFSSENFVINSLKAAESCISDAQYRWKKPIQSSEFAEISYYINILDSLDKWERYSYAEILNTTAGKGLDKKTYGYKYQFKTHNATYLPGVWDENKKRWPTFNDMIEDLIKKAFRGQNIDIKLNFLIQNGNYYTYKTKYIEEPLLNINC